MMSERWVPVAPEDIKGGDRIRFRRVSSLRWFDVAEIDGPLLRGTSVMADGVTPNESWYIGDEWERLVSDTTDTVSLPAPPEGAQWRLMPDNHHKAVMRRFWRYEGESWEDYRELNAEPVPPIEAGMWVHHGTAVNTDQIPYYVGRVTENGRAVVWWEQKPGWWSGASDPVHANWVPCDPPDNAQELYDLLGIKTP